MTCGFNRFPKHPRNPQTPGNRPCWRPHCRGLWQRRRSDRSRCWRDCRTDDIHDARSIDDDRSRDVDFARNDDKPDRALGAQLADVSELIVRARSTDGRAYELIADDSLARSSRQVMHFTDFPISGSGSGSGEWEDVIVPIANLEQRVFGNPVTVEPF